MSSEDLKNEIRKLNPNKASLENDIPAEILIASKDIVSYYLSNIYIYIYNNCKQDNKYPLSLTAAEVTSIHKKYEKTAMKNYRPVSLIPIVSKFFERNMYDQILVYIKCEIFRTEKISDELISAEKNSDRFFENVRKFFRPKIFPAENVSFPRV